jgi:hypothetical protein
MKNLSDNEKFIFSFHVDMVVCYGYNKIIVLAEGGEICGDLCQSGECCF